MALAISTNPHIKNPKELWNTLDQQERQNEGKEYVDAEFNQAEFDRFKVAVQGKSKSIIVK